MPGAWSEGVGGRVGLIYSLVVTLLCLGSLALAAVQDTRSAPTPTAAPPGRIWVGNFSTLRAGEFPEGWEHRHLSGDGRRTRYSISIIDGKGVLRAESDGSASALLHRVTIDPAKNPYLNWSWRTDTRVVPADWKLRETDDFALRLFVLFEADDAGPFSFFGRMFSQLLEGFNGYALNYVWTAREAEGEVAPSPVTDQVRMIAVGTVETGLDKWHVERRNVLEDFRRAFGMQAGKIVAVAVMTDTDDTMSQCVSYFGDIYFSAAPQR